MSAAVTDVDRGYNALVRRVFEFGRPVLKAGILERDADQPAASVSASKPTGLTVGDVALFNEFGLGVPERSFLRAWFDANEAAARSVLASRLRGVIKGKITKLQALAQLGAFCVGGIQQRIADGIPPPNADSTIARKGSATPLIATGQMRSSVSWAVEERE